MLLCSTSIQEHRRMPYNAMLLPQALVLGFFAGSALAAPHAVRNNDGKQPYVNIDSGTVYGVSYPAYGQELFLGIPYAEPPVGSLRLRPPQPITRDLGDIDATQYGPHCWSRYGPAYDDNSGFDNSEDCLTINVVRPYGIYKGGKKAPVVAWIHGGGLTTGGSADYRYNSSALVDASVKNGKPIVFVSMNYRLGSLGFLGGKALADEGSLNLGLRDQRLALHWIQDNIAEFGGDAREVTIMGESAGGRSVVSHLTAYSGRDDGLFNKAIIESGGGFNIIDQPDGAPYESNFQSLVANTSCATTTGSWSAELACIRGLSIDEFRQNSNGTTGLLRDNDIFQVKSPVVSFTTGQYVKGPILIGSNTDEGRSFSTGGANTTEEAKALFGAPEQYLDGLAELYPNISELGCPFYTGDYQLSPVQNGQYYTPGSQNKRVSAVVGDLRQQAGPRFLGQTVSKEVPVYKYHFNRIPWTVSYGIEDFVGHFTEVSYVFNLQNNDTAFWEENHFTATYLGPGAPIHDRFLGDYMSRSWASFIATGDPNHANLSSKVYWPAYAEGAKEIVFEHSGSYIGNDDYRKEGIQYIIDNILLEYST